MVIIISIRCVLEAGCGWLPVLGDPCTCLKARQNMTCCMLLSGTKRVREHWCQKRGEVVANKTISFNPRIYRLQLSNIHTLFQIDTELGDHNINETIRMNLEVENCFFKQR